MKKLILFLIFGACFLGVHAQFDPGIPSTSWSLLGNTGTSTRNFLGTTDCQPLIFKTNGTERMWLSSNGSFLGIGILNTNSTLHLHYQMDEISCDSLLLPKTLKLMSLTTPESARGGFGIISNGTDIRFKQQEQANFSLEGREPLLPMAILEWVHLNRKQNWM